MADYFDMLRNELLGEHYVKAEHNRKLRPLLHDRSQQSVEFKHSNISAVLIEEGLPYIPGYQPRRNYQSALRHAVELFLSSNPEYLAVFDHLPMQQIDQVPILDQVVLDTPPEEIIFPREPTAPWQTREGRRVDFAAREAANRQLGRTGEQWVIEFERRRLLTANRNDLAERIEWVVDTCGDGIGFDVLSFDEHTSNERHIEVKTTTQGKHFPFYLTRNEVKCSHDLAGTYHLYRVFQFGAHPAVFQLRGSLASILKLEPMVFRAGLGA